MAFTQPAKAASPTLANALLKTTLVKFSMPTKAISSATFLPKVFAPNVANCSPNITVCNFTGELGDVNNVSNVATSLLASVLASVNPKIFSPKVKTFACFTIGATEAIYPEDNICCEGA